MTVYSEWSVLDRHVYMILDRKTGEPVGSYSRSYHDEYEFRTRDAALNANCHGMFKDEDKYEIARYLVTYKRVDDDAKS